MIEMEPPNHGTTPCSARSTKTRATHDDAEKVLLMSKAAAERRGVYLQLAGFCNFVRPLRQGSSRRFTTSALRSSRNSRSVPDHRLLLDKRVILASPKCGMNTSKGLDAVQQRHRPEVGLRQACLQGPPARLR